MRQAGRWPQRAIQENRPKVANSLLQSYCQSKPLRPYQSVATAAVNAELERRKRVLLVAPTGAGKSRMSAECMLPAAKGLVLTHTTILREQSKATLPGCAVATIQSLTGKGPGAQSRRERLREFDRFFVDEAHHLVGPEWIQLVPYMAHGALFGATATPQRADGTPLEDAFEQLVVAAKYSELVLDGFLCPCDVAHPELSRAQQKKQKVKVDGVQSYLDHGRVLGTADKWRPGIYFAPTIIECQNASLRFNNAGIRSAVVSCDVVGEERQNLFDAYAASELDMLCSPMALSEGFDSPRAEVCVLCRSASSLSVYIQMVGRVLRPFDGWLTNRGGLRVFGRAKDRALLIDCTDAARIHGSPTQDRRYSLSGAGIETVEDDDLDAAELEREVKEREAWKLIQIKYEIVRDRLRSRFTTLQQVATDTKKGIGWVANELKRELQVKDDRGFVTDPVRVPRALYAKRQHVCAHCRHRVSANEPVLGEAPHNIYHRDCWIESLAPDALDKLS